MCSTLDEQSAAGLMSHKGVPALRASRRRQLFELAEHLVQFHQSMVHHSLPSPPFRSSGQAFRAVTAFHRRSERWEITVITVGITDEERVRHRSTLAEIYSELHKWF